MLFSLPPKAMLDEDLLSTLTGIMGMKVLVIWTSILLVMSPMRAMRARFSS